MIEHVISMFDENDNFLVKEDKLPSYALLFDGVFFLAQKSIVDLKAWFRSWDNQSRYRIVKAKSYHLFDVQDMEGLRIGVNKIYFEYV